MDAGYILAPHTVRVRFELAPALSAYESIRELTEVERLSGFGGWVTQTFSSLPQERLDTNLLLCKLAEPLLFMIMPPLGYADFPSYIDAIAARDPFAIRDAVVAEFAQYPKHDPGLWDSARGELTAERLVSDEAAFVDFFGAMCAHVQIGEALLHQGYRLISNPVRFQAALVEHLRYMWYEHLAVEWRRIEPMLRESVAAFERLDFPNLTAYEAIRAVTTRDLRGMMDEKLTNIDALVFVPSAHIGPYIVRIHIGAALYVIFGARQPRGVEIASSALSRSELLTRLNALADDTRLRILELLTQHEELCAQDIIEMTELSQSSISRHLSQLSANGLITERRRDVSKCYSLNTDRVMDTLRTLTNFLTRISPPLPPEPPLPPAPPVSPLPPLTPIPPEPPGV